MQLHSYSATSGGLDSAMVARSCLKGDSREYRNGWVATLVWNIACLIAITTSATAFWFAYQKAGHSAIVQEGATCGGQPCLPGGGLKPLQPLQPLQPLKPLQPWQSLPLARVPHPFRSVRVRASSEFVEKPQEVNSAACSDDDVACPSWHKRGLCKNNGLSSFVRASCAASCQLCDAGHRTVVWGDATAEPATKALPEASSKTLPEPATKGKPGQVLPVQGEGDTEARSFSIYTAAIQVGTPSQTLTVAIDSGSPNLWVPDVTCKLSNTLQGPWSACNSASFDASRSTSGVNPDAYNKMWPVAYAGGGLLAARSVDTVTLASLRVERLAFYRGVKVVGPDFKYGKFDGVLGLSRIANFVSYQEKQMKPGKKTHAKPQGQANFNLLRAARDSRALHQALVAFLLVPPHKSKAGCDGMVTLGGYNRAHYKGDITWHDVLHVKDKYRRGQWLIRVDRLTAGSDPTNICGSGGCEALLDSGTSSLRLPSAGRIATAAGIVPDCSHLKQSQGGVTLGMGGASYPLSASQVTFVMDNALTGPVCKSNIEHTEAGRRTGIVLGTPFFEAYFVVLDNEDPSRPRVGIAPPVHAAISGCRKARP